MSDNKALDYTDDPTWIFDGPSDDHIAPPVEMREQELPFDKLSWQNFERLCHKLARTDGDIERCRLYGTQGHDEASRGRTRTTAFEAKPGTSAACRGVPAIGASFSLPHLPAKVSSLNTERPLSFGGAN